MGCSIPLLVSLCVLSAVGQEYYEYTGTDGNYEYYYDDSTDSPGDVIETTLDDWIFELLDTIDHCSSEPCANGASCENTAEGGFRCHCSEPFTGKTCQTVKDYCKGAKCGRGTCVFKSSYPYYECKCKHPYRPPDCKKAAACRPNPCQNGGSCLKGSKRTSFKCSCPSGYTGKFCEVGPNDCYQEDGETYRGMVSVTLDGDECLDWNSYFILQKGGDPFTEYAGFDGLGPHNFCRNPDGETQPWCFINQNGQLKWKLCNVRQCSTTPVTPPTIYESDVPTPAPNKPDISAPSGSFSQCGQPQPGRTSRIYGGKKSLPGAHPWQVSLQIRPRYSSNPFSHICGGILLSSCWVLTAAHCIKNDVEMQVVLGGVDIERHEVYDQTIPVERAVVHENYRQSPFALYNDIAMLKLKATDKSLCAKETRFVKAACLPAEGFPSGTECVISGWGVTETQRHGTNYLLDARVLLISQDKCKAPHVYGDSLDDSMFCAGNMNGGVDTCQGDSGGPLVCARNGIHYVVGVVSWGDGCGKKYKPGVYANVGKFTNWISNQLNS
ncbi:hyaluronan-binding protein 2-like [Periophthalmus magnuspinnatus]|uniref:hyaluronan-binding protein 2-like n=1 Tax=Periophthalmus magnuspinnatus TaxID=409849 RepID=UPI0024365E02|nr:hyaluronan-binding protein 2-like [Periophthalmus magnuspinnatus]